MFLLLHGHILTAAGREPVRVVSCSDGCET